MATKRKSMDAPKQPTPKKVVAKKPAVKKAVEDKPVVATAPVETQQIATLAAVDEVLAPKRPKVHPHHQPHPHHPAMPYLVAALVGSLGLMAFAVLQAPPAQKFTPPKGDMAAEAQAANDSLEQSAGQLNDAALDDATLSADSFTK